MPRESLRTSMKEHSSNDHNENPLSADAESEKKIRLLPNGAEKDGNDVVDKDDESEYHLVDRSSDVDNDGDGEYAPFIPPDFDHPDRQGRIWSARLNLLTSMVGGGSLSLPLAFALAGNAFGGPLLVLICASASSFTLRALMDASTKCSQLQASRDRRKREQEDLGQDQGQQHQDSTCVGKRYESSYEAVASEAFGPRARHVAMWLVVLACFFGSLAYCVLLRDLAVPLADFLSPQEQQSGSNSSPSRHRLSVVRDVPSTREGGPTVTENAIMFFVVLLVSPLCTLKTLTALRSVGALSMLSVAVLGFCIVYRSIQCNFNFSDQDVEDQSHQIGKWVDYITFIPSSFHDFANAFPVIQSCFFCHFNAVPVHNELRRPTSARVARLTRTTVATASAFYWIVGFFGSMYGNCLAPNGKGVVSGNILLDFDDCDPILTIGRICLGVTIALAFPMQIIPARDTLIRLYSSGRFDQDHNEAEDEGGEERANDIYVGAVGGDRVETADLEEPLLPSRRGWRDVDEERASSHTTDTTDSEEGNSQEMCSDADADDGVHLYVRNNSRRGTEAASHATNCRCCGISPKFLPPRHCFSDRDQMIRSLVALSLFWISAGVAALVKSVDVVWDLLGSSLVIIIGFLLPSGAYLKLCRKGGKLRRNTAWGVLAIYFPLMILCTANAVGNVFFGE